MSVASRSTHTKSTDRRWHCSLLAAICGTVILTGIPTGHAWADPGSTALALQAGPIHTSVAVDEPSVRQRLIPSEVVPAEPTSRIQPAIVPTAARLPATAPSMNVLPASAQQAAPRRELWAREVVTAGPAIDQRGTAVRMAQAPTRRAQPVPEEIPGGPVDNNGGRLPFDDDIKPLNAARNNLQPPPGEMPADYAQARFEDEQPIVGGSEADRQPTGVVYFWEATALCYQPIYIEDVNLERYGYSHGVLQPFVSAVHFFGTIPLLPYKMGMHPESECIYSLGYYRPGTPAPYQTSRLGWSWRGAICEAGAIGAFIAWIPSGKFY